MMTAHSRSSTDDPVVIDRDDISNFNPEHILPESPEEIKNIRKWLRPTSYAHESGEFRKHLASHMPGTGAWLQTSDTFKTWLSSQNHGMLWIKGIPGAGKSVVAAHLIDFISRSHPGVPVLYFFFRQIIDANHEPAALLRDYLDQVLEYSPPLQKELKELVETQRSQSSLSIDDLWGFLRLALAGLPGKAFCIADALDEMDQGNDEFLRALASFGKWRPKNVKVLVTSRPVPSVELPLRQANMLRMRLEEKLVDADISSYVERGLRASVLTLNAQNLVREAIPGHANGIFLYAKLAMDAFLEPGAKTEEVLRTLPSDLHEMYTRLLHERAVRSGVPHDIQLLILQWVTHATRPLRLLELAEMISVTHQHINGMKKKIEIKFAKDLVRAAAGPLLEILPNETVCVIHHSFTEYLKCMTRSETDGGYPILRFSSTHARLALACITYLQAGCLDKIVLTETASYDLSNYGDREALHKKASHSRFYGRNQQIVEEEQRTRLQYPFFAYAITNWHLHVTRSGATGFAQKDITAAIQDLLSNDQRMKALLKLQWAENEELSIRVTPLHVAARYGLIELVRRLLSKEVDVNTGDVCGKSALWWAAKSGHADVIQLLVEAGADPDVDDKIVGLKPLHQAASENHADAVRALLEAGVDPLTRKTRESPGRRCGNAPRSRGHTPLMYACRNGHLEALEAFLPFLKDIDTVHRALAWSAERGRYKLVASILHHPGINVDAKVHGDTALYLACNSADPDTIMTLLEAGADPTILCTNAGDEFGGIGSRCYWFPGRKKDETRGYSALHALCNQGNYRSSIGEQDPEKFQELFSLLLEKGASVHQRTDSGSTPLHAAVNNPIFTRLLLRAGADPNAVDDQGCIALHAVTSPDIADLLLEDGHADIDRIRPSDGKSPILCVLGQYKKEVILRLLAHRPNLTIKDAKGDGPLHIALTQSTTDTTILEALLCAGADPNQRNRAHKTPLMVMRMDNRESVAFVDLLLRYGANINAKDPLGMTLLSRTMGSHSYSGRSNHGDAKGLLERGADLNVRDYRGKTLLHHAVAMYDRMGSGVHPRQQDVTRLDFALTLGLDVQSLDYDGNTLIHEAALRSGILDSYYASIHVALLKKLLGLGIDINQGNHRGRTALHMLAAIGSSNWGSPMSKSGLYDPLDFVISKVQNLDQRDHQGLTALHLASTVSETSVKRLLDAGADPNLASLDGLTPLHLATRARQSNIVGLLLGTSKIRGTTAVDAVDEKGKAPLYYACRSGMGETVKMLLDAGADASHKSLFLACAQFEEEQGLWNADRHAADMQANQGATGLTIDDKTRPGKIPSNSTQSNEIDIHRDLPRLDEILDLLIDHGCDATYLLGSHNGWYSTSALSNAANSGYDYTLSCLLRARDKVFHNQEVISTSSLSYEERAVKAKEQADIDVATQAPDLKPGHANQRMIVRLLKKRQYYVMQPLFDQGVNFLEGRGNNSCSNLDLFAEHGYISLLAKIGSLEVERQFKDADFHAYGDKSKPGLHKDVNLEELKVSNNNQVIPLLTALRRAQPNMEVVRLLVEKFRVDVNQACYERHRLDNGKYDMVPSETALHYLAQGIHWWHVALALPYLISKGANVDAKNQTGNTPLHIAIAGPNRYVGPFHKEAAKALVVGGADVNAQDGSGKSCLATAAGDMSIVQLLIDHKVSIDADALLVAVDTRQTDVLKALLKAGADPNLRRKPVAPSPKSNSKRRRRAFSLTSHRNIPLHEELPLYTAATKFGSLDWSSSPEEKKAHWRKELELVEALLSAGADPLASFKRRNSEYRQNDYDEDKDDQYVRGLFSRSQGSQNEYEDTTLIHELLDTHELVHPILELDVLDANERDGYGRTLLHLACHRHALVAPIDVSFESRDEEYKSALPSFLDRLLAMGADPLATDFSGKSLLHHIFVNNKRRCSSDRDVASLKRIIDQYPILINKVDNFGNTPLHMAVKHAVIQGHTTPAEVLLNAGADPIAFNKDGDGCLHFLSFCIYRSSSIRSLFARLLKEGLDINAKNNRGETPVFNLNKHLPGITMDFKADDPINAADGISLFETAGADLLVRDVQGRGLLHIAAKETVEYKKDDRFARMFSQDSKNTTELSIARFQVLLQKGLDPMMEDAQKRTALDVAAAFGKESVLKLFDKDYISPSKPAVLGDVDFVEDDEDL